MFIKYSFASSDSWVEIALRKKFKIVDSTTISPFKDILKCVGRKSIDGKSKGGIKSHCVINADEKVPNLIWFSAATTHDRQFLEKLKCNEQHFIYLIKVTMITGFSHFTEKKTGFVTRIKSNAKYEKIQSNEIQETIIMAFYLMKLLRLK